MGYSYNIDFTQLSFTFVESNRKVEQKNPSGTAYFKSYDKVKEFIDYIESSNKIKWIYIIPFKNGEKKYYRDVTLKKFDKTEKMGKWLACPVEFAGESLWYEENTVIYKIEPQTNEIRWNFKWNSKFKDYNIRKLIYKNQGHVEAPILVEIDGAVNNPKIEIYINEQLYQQVTINTEIAEYEKLLYCSKENEFYIQRLKTDGTKESLFDLDIINFENNNVIRLPKGYDCEIRLVADNTIQNAKITILPQYVAI